MARPVKNRYSRTLALPRFLIIPRKIDRNLEGQTMPLSRCVLSVHTNCHYPPRYVSLLMTVMMMMMIIALIFQASQVCVPIRPKSQTKSKVTTFQNMAFIKGENCQQSFVRVTKAWCERAFNGNGWITPWTSTQTIGAAASWSPTFFWRKCAFCSWEWVTGVWFYTFSRMSGNSRSRPFPGMKASDSHSWIMGIDFFISFPFLNFENVFFPIPFPFPKSGNVFFYSLPVLELWE